MDKKHEVLFTQLHEYRNDLLSIIEGITEEQADIVPEHFNNNIRWNLGHVFLDQYHWIKALTKEEQPIPEGFNQWFGFGTKPEDWSNEPPSLQELCQLLKEQPTEIQERYGERLEEEFPPTEMGMYTLEQVLMRTVFHEGLHIGAIIAIKRNLFSEE